MLSYIQQFLIIVSAVSGCIPISAFVSLLGILIRITSSAIRLKIYAITLEAKKCNSIIKRRKTEEKEGETR